MSLLDRLHGGYVFHRRVHVLAGHLADLFARNTRILDIGCGSGVLGAEIMRRRDDLQLVGIDTLVRPSTQIPVTEFDGRSIPFPDRSFDAALIVDVLHHTEDPGRLLREAARVAPAMIVLKDHLRQGVGAEATLRFMDWVGNARLGVALPYNYLSPAEWMNTFRTAGVRELRRATRLNLYPAPASWLFDRSLHFISILEAEPVGTSRS